MLPRPNTHAPVSLGGEVMSEASLPAPRHGHALFSGDGTFRAVFEGIDIIFS